MTVAWDSEGLDEFEDIRTKLEDGVSMEELFWLEGTLFTEEFTTKNSFWNHNENRIYTDGNHLLDKLEEVEEIERLAQKSDYMAKTGKLASVGFTSLGIANFLIEPNYENAFLMLASVYGGVKGWEYSRKYQQPIWEAQNRINEADEFMRKQRDEDNIGYTVQIQDRDSLMRESRRIELDSEDYEVYGKPGGIVTTDILDFEHPTQN